MSQLVTISIDGKKIQAAEGANLLQIAHDNGIKIPSLCYHKKLSPTGACRLCVAKIKGAKGLLMSCTVKITDGMEVIAFDDELEQTRKQTLDYLFVLKGLLEKNQIFLLLWVLVVWLFLEVFL